MVGNMYGADADELEAIAAELESYDDELGHLLSQGVGSVALLGLSATLNSIWAGPRASEFSGIWQSRHLLRVRDVQATLREAAADLRRNAAEQRRTSGVVKRGIVTLPDVFLRPMPLPMPFPLRPLPLEDLIRVIGNEAGPLVMGGLQVIDGSTVEWNILKDQVRWEKPFELFDISAEHAFWESAGRGELCLLYTSPSPRD